MDSGVGTHDARPAVSGRAPARPATSLRTRVLLAILLLAVSAVWLTRNTGRPLTGDSVRYAAIAREMVESGDWLQPRVRGQIDLWKPPLAYWLVATSISALGPTTLAAMLPSIVAGVLLLLLLFLVVDRWSGPVAGVSAALTLLFFPQFTMHTITCRMESLLSLFILLALVAVEKGRERPAWFVGFWACVGAAILTKGTPGLVALLLPALVSALTRSAFPFDRPRFWAALPVALLVAGPWYAVMSWRHGEAFWAWHLGREVGERLGASERGALLSTLMASIEHVRILLPLALVGGIFALRDARGDPRRTRLTILGAAWFAFVLGSQAFNRTPFPRYMYNAFAPIAAFAGIAIAGLVGRRAFRSLPQIVLATALLFAVGVRIFEPSLAPQAIAHRAVLDGIASDAEPGPVLAVAPDPDTPEVFVWFHLHRTTRTIAPKDLAYELVARRDALSGRVAVVERGAWESIDSAGLEILRRGDVFTLVRFR